MNYKFPEIRHLNDVKHVLDSCDDFMFAEREKFDVINYQVAFGDTFPEVLCKDDAIRREFRGLIFDKEGKLIRRPFHKFFNVGEREETKSIDLRKPHVILEKLDGSMIAPFVIDDEVYWATKMGSEDFHNDVKEFVANSDIDYEKLVRENSDEYTFIFEWVSPDNRIVVRYDEPQLILTGARLLHTGDYINYEFLTHFIDNFYQDIPLVKAYDGSVENMEELIKYTSDLEQEEGYVIVFNDGHRVKIKSDWYCHLHKVKSYFDYEKDVARLILNGDIDDLLPLLDEEDQRKINAYSTELHDFKTLLTKQAKLAKDSYRESAGVDRKEFAIHHFLEYKCVRNITFANWDNTEYDVEKEVFNNMLNACSGSHNKWKQFKEQNDVKEHELKW